MMTGQSIRTCLRREVPTDHEAHSHTQREQLRERVWYALSNRASAGMQPGGRSGNTMIQSRRVHDRGKPSRAKLDERCRTPFAVQTFEAKTPTTRRFQRRAKVDHVARRNPRPCRRDRTQEQGRKLYGWCTHWAKKASCYGVTFLCASSGEKNRNMFSLRRPFPSSAPSNGCGKIRSVGRSRLVSSQRLCFKF